MIEVSDTVRAVIDSGTFTYDVKVSSWLGDELLADDIPIDDAAEESDRSLNVPERVRFTVPKRDRGTSWVPAAEDSPLAANGQTLKVSLGVGKGRGIDGVEWFQRGEFLILSAEEGDETVEVTAAGLLYLAAEAGFVAPFQPSGTIGGTLRALVEPAVQVNLDSAPTDRSVPAAITWDDRIGAVYELLDAWPAVPRMNEQGYLEVLPDVTPTVAVRSFTNAAGGTVVSSVGTSTREGGFNVVVATGNAVDGTEVRGQAYVTEGPWAYPGGAANPLPVPFGYASPLLTTQAQCVAAARTVLNRKLRQAILRRFTVTAVLDPTIQLGDAVSITDDEVTDLLCTVERIVLPYRPGAMQLTVVSTT
jgi:hypothetical protein